MMRRALAVAAASAAMLGAFAMPANASTDTNGWTLRPRLIVSPQGWVWYSALPHCRNEDGSGQRSACTWNLGPGTDGNGRGDVLWYDRQDRRHVVRGWVRR